MKPVEERLNAAADMILVAAGVSPFGFMGLAAKARIKNMAALDPAGAELLAQRVAETLRA